MKTAPLPYLNLDAATALALPLADVEARAQFRFCFRLPDGAEEWLLARLCVVQAYTNGHSRYCVILRPEDAESDRAFVREHMAYRTNLKETMTLDEAVNHEWDVFAREFNDHDTTCSQLLARYWMVEEEGYCANVKFQAGGKAEVVGVFRRDVGGQSEEGFNWDDGRRYVSTAVDEMNFLRTSHDGFRHQIQIQWADPDNQLQNAVRWARLNNSQRDELTFKCINGSWAQLREIAVAALRVRLNLQRPPIESSCLWNIVKSSSTTIIEIDAEGKTNLSALCDDEALLVWRAALLKQFGSVNVFDEGEADHSLPRYLFFYLAYHEEAFIEVAPPTMHEVMEAQLKLRDWTNAHFAPDEAARLLGLLMK